MKTKDFLNEVKTLDTKALILRAKTLKGEVADLVLDKNINKLKDLRSVSKKRRELARVMTVLSQKMMIERLEKVSEVPEVPQEEEKKEVKKETKK